MRIGVGEYVRRVAVSLVVTALAAALSAFPAAGKEGVEATLASHVPLDAEPGARLTIRWTLAYFDEERKRRPFGANGVFVRLVSMTGARAETGLAPIGAHSAGEYAANVVVPKGGIGDIEIGLRGVASGPGGTKSSDLLFPITNDPVPGSARASPSASAEPAQDREDGRATAGVFVAGLTLLGMCAVAVAVAVARRKHA